MGRRITHRRTSPTRAPLAACIIAAASTSAALAAPPAPQPSLSSPSTLRRVDEGIEDTGLLRLGGRVAPLDLRMPAGFDEVYRIPGAPSGIPGVPGAPDQFARISGGVAAVFPFSEYTLTKDGLAVLIPAGTKYFIGNLPKSGGKPTPTPTPGLTAASSKAHTGDAAKVSAQRLDDPAPHAGPLDLRVTANDTDPGADHAPKAAPKPEHPAPPEGVLINETYRRLRVRELLMASGGIASAASPSGAGSANIPTGDAPAPTQHAAEDRAIP